MRRLACQLLDCQAPLEQISSIDAQVGVHLEWDLKKAGARH